MLLVLVRHGIAEEREQWAKTGRPDSQRPLTKQGRWKMERVAKGLKRCVTSVDLLCSSPLIRAAETAAIISAAYHGIPVSDVPSFAPDSAVDSQLEWLRRHRAADTVVVVGHEPVLGVFATWLLSGVKQSRLVFRKGGVAAIEFSGAPRAGDGQLLWAMPPNLLRRIGD
jgi:phosphohistidine phosphatase